MLLFNDDADILISRRCLATRDSVTASRLLLLHVYTWRIEYDDYNEFIAEDTSPV